MDQQTIVSEQDSAAFISLDRLEARIHGAIDLLSTARRQKADAEEEATRLTDLLAEKEQHLGRLMAQLEQLQVERLQVRERIENLLDQIEQLGG